MVLSLQDMSGSRRLHFLPGGAQVKWNWLGGTREELGSGWGIPGSELKGLQSLVLWSLLSSQLLRTASWLW